MRRMVPVAVHLALAVAVVMGDDRSRSSPNERPRLRDLGLAIGVHAPGRWNAITDVPGVKVGHVTLIQGTSVRTGVTVVLPHDGNLYRERVPAAIYVANGFGKLVGYTQVRELGEIETPIALTNTLSVWDVAIGLVQHTLQQPGNEQVRSVNPVVAETNDGYLNDIRGRHVRPEHVLQAIEKASTGPVPEGCVGAGTGTVCFGFKGGIGTSSRLVKAGGAQWTVGALVQTNYGGRLVFAGRELWRRLPAPSTRPRKDGSCVIVIATDAPLESSQLERLARRAIAGMARTGASFSHGSGDYVITFSTAPAVRRHRGDRSTVRRETLAHEALDPLFEAVAEATEEAILNSLLRATDMVGYQGRRVRALPLELLEGL